jgi:DNA-binding CsgD family transcriptional regulator
MLTRRDYKQVLDIINFVYSVPKERGELFQCVFEILQKMVNFNSAAYIPWNAESQGFQLDGNVVFNASEKDLALYLESYSSLDPYIETGVHLMALNRAIKITDFVSLSRYKQTRYAREFAPLIPCFYEMNAMLSSQGDPIGGIALHRQPRDRDFTERDRQILNLVIPHLSLAVHKMDVLDAISSSQNTGVIVLRPNGNPVFMNSVAQKALNGAPVTTIPIPSLDGDSIIFKTQSTAYRVRTAPTRWDRKGKVVYLDPQPTESNIQAKLADYGLSRREQEVALWVMRGLSNREIAEKLFICEQTVKDHLRDVFEHTHVRRRSELVSKVVGLDDVGP